MYSLYCTSTSLHALFNFFIVLHRVQCKSVPNNNFCKLVSETTKGMVISVNIGFPYGAGDKCGETELMFSVGDNNEFLQRKKSVSLCHNCQTGFFSVSNSNHCKISFTMPLFFKKVIAKHFFPASLNDAPI